MTETICFRQGFIDLAGRYKRGEIWVYSWAVGRTPAEYIVNWSERIEPVKQAVQQELFALQISSPIVTDKELT